MKIKFSFQWREHEDTKDVEGYINWIKTNIVPATLQIKGVAHCEVSQSIPFSFIPDHEPQTRYVCQLDVFYKTEEDFKTSLENFNDPFIVQEIIKATPYLDIHICYIEKMERKKVDFKNLFGTW